MNTEQLTYSDFRRQYEEQHPASVPRKELFEEIGEYPKWLYWMTGFMFVCAALVSGVHTIVEVYMGMEANNLIPREVQQIIAYTSFAAIELCFFLGAFLILREKVYGWGVMVVSFLVAVIANLDSVNRALSNQGNVTEWTYLVTFALGVGAPLIALMAGKMFVNMQRSERAAFHRAQQRYQDAMILWDKEVEKAWKSYGKAIEKQTMPSVSVSVPELPPPAVRLQPIKDKVGDKIMYTCPACQRQMTRQAWSTHKCRQTDTSTDSQLTRQPLSMNHLPASNDPSSNGNGIH